MPESKKKISEDEVSTPSWRKSIDRARRAQSSANKQAPKPMKRQPPSPPGLNKVINLPVWSDQSRGTPNSILRSALFAAIQGKTRRALKNELLGSQNGYTIRFTGWQLDQADLDVWEQAVHLVRLNHLGTECYFNAGTFLKAIGRAHGSSGYEWLNDAITRLIACAVEIRVGNNVFTGSLLTSCVRDEDTGRYRLQIDADILTLYGEHDWTAIEWEQRAALKGKPLALWLHGYYATHAVPFPVKVSTLYRMSGGSAKALRNFKIALKKALDVLKEIKFLSSWEIDKNDLITVQRIGKQVE